MKRSRSLSFLFCAAALTAGCDANYHLGELKEPVGCMSDEVCTDGAECDLSSGACVRPAPTNALDLLFVIDNSYGMISKQAALVASIPGFVAKLDQLGVDYHIGVVTPDLGSLPAGGSPGAGWPATCTTFEGYDGRLQATPCSHRPGITTQATMECSRACPDPRFVPKDGTRFISKRGSTTNVPQDLKLDPKTGRMVDYGPSNALKCMALLGDDGCRIEGPLEAAKRALDGHLSENSGFLRSGSMLAVLFLTDEDDCSVKAARRSENSDASNRNCSAPDRNASYQCFNSDYRCFARSVECDEPLNTAGIKNNCKQRSDSYLEPVQTYARFFATLRTRSRLVIGGIWSPDPKRGGRVEIVSADLSNTSTSLNRATGSGAACTNAGDATIYGQPQLRLSAFARSFTDGAGRPASLESSVCDTSGYAAALDQIAATLAARAGWPAAF